MAIKLSTEHLLLIVFLTFCEISPCLPKISDKRLCYDPQCSVAVSQGKTLMTYHSNDKDILSFPINADVLVYSKSAGKRKDLWGVQIQGKRGYAPKSLIHEKKILQKTLEHEVPTERVASENISKDHKTTNDKDGLHIPTIIDGSIDSGISSPVTPQVSPSFEVIDGTTIHLAPSEQPRDESYATKVRHSPASSEEQPILSVHPNVPPRKFVMNEGLLAEAAESPLSGETVSPELENVASPVIPPAATSEPESQEDKEEDDAEDVEDVESEESDGTVENTETLREKKEIDENAAVGEATAKEELPQDAPTTFEKIEENQQEMVQTPELPKPAENSITSETTEPTQEKALNPSEFDSESDSAPIGEIVTPSPDVQTTEDILVNAFHTVTSMFSPPSTESPPLEDTVAAEEEAASTSAKDPDHTPDSPVAVESQQTEEVPESTPDTPVSQQTGEVPTSKPDPSEAPDADVKLESTTVTPEKLEVDSQTVIANESETVENVATDVSDHVTQQHGQPGIYEHDELSGSSQDVNTNQFLNFNEFPASRNLLNVESGRHQQEYVAETKAAPEVSTLPPISETPEVPAEVIPPIVPPTEPPAEAPSDPKAEDAAETLKPVEDLPLPLEGAVEETTLPTLDVADESHELSDAEPVSPPDVCEADNCSEFAKVDDTVAEEKQEESMFDDTALINAIKLGRNYWETLSYLGLTAFTTLLFSLGYYYIENRRRDGEFIAKINKLERELLVATKECSVLDETLKSTKNKLTSIEDESFGSNEMVASLKSDLHNAHKAKSELEDQVAALEKDLESATEAGLELERMLREILASNSAENPLAKSLEDLQARLNVQQSANESLTNALQLKTQENEKLQRELANVTQKCEQLEVEVTRNVEELKEEKRSKSDIEQTLSGKIAELEKQVKDITAEKITLRKQLKGKEMEIADLLDVVKQANLNNIDFDKLADVSRIKAEASQLAEERDELKIKLSEVEGAHQLLEEHMKVINEEVLSLSEQCKLAEKEKKEAQTRLEVLSNFFKEKEAERQKEETAWLQQQGEVSTTIERLQTMHNEIQSYKQQIESLKREILDQEKEYKNQITSLESKAHEQWVLARQNERRLEESKAEAGQLRNRLTLIEKNYSDTESDVKLHRMEANGETATSPSLFIGAEASSSPVMFSGTSCLPPPPPSYLYGPPLPPYMPPPLPPPPALQPYDVSQRPPPLGGRLASPPPIPPHHPPTAGRYDSPGSPPPPPLSPTALPHFTHRNFPPMPFGNERIPPPPLPPLGNPSWADESLPPTRNTGFHPFHREQQQRSRDKGSLHSSGESLDKSHHSGKV